MKKSELIVLIVLVCILVSLNVFHYVQRETARKNLAFIVEELKVQISINTAEASELEALPGIGPALATRIVRYRERVGGFKRLDDLKEVKGIGEKLYQILLPHITL